MIGVLLHMNKIPPYGGNNNNLMFTSESNNNYFSTLEIRNNILEEGRECFTHWLSAEEGNGERNNYIQLSLKIFEKDSRILIHDNFHNIDIEVKFDNGFQSAFYVILMTVPILDLQFVQNKIFDFFRVLFLEF